MPVAVATQPAPYPQYQPVAHPEPPPPPPLQLPPQLSPHPSPLPQQQSPRDVSPSTLQDEEPRALSKCHVLYLGSSVPLDTAKGVEAVQKPFSERYPTDPTVPVQGIDAWVTVFTSGVMLQYTDAPDPVAYWFPIQNLKLASAVKCLSNEEMQHRGPPTGGPGPLPPVAQQRFALLEASDAAAENVHHPLFAAILRRNKGVKVLECHCFITRSVRAAVALASSCAWAVQHKEGWRDAQPPRHIMERELVASTAERDQNGVETDVQVINFDQEGAEESGDETSGGLIRRLDGNALVGSVDTLSISSQVTSQSQNIFEDGLALVGEYNLRRGARAEPAPPRQPVVIPMASQPLPPPAGLPPQRVVTLTRPPFHRVEPHLLMEMPRSVRVAPPPPRPLLVPRYPPPIPFPMSGPGPQPVLLRPGPPPPPPPPAPQPVVRPVVKIVEVPVPVKMPPRTEVKIVEVPVPVPGPRPRTPPAEVKVVEVPVRVEVPVPVPGPRPATPPPEVRVVKVPVPGSRPPTPPAPPPEVKVVEVPVPYPVPVGNRRPRSRRRSPKDYVVYNSAPEFENYRMPYRREMYRMDEQRAKRLSRGRARSLSSTGSSPERRRGSPRRRPPGDTDGGWYRVEPESRRRERRRDRSPSPDYEITKFQSREAADKADAAPGPSERRQSHLRRVPARSGPDSSPEQDRVVVYRRVRGDGERDRRRRRAQSQPRYASGYYYEDDDEYWESRQDAARGRKADKRKSQPKQSKWGRMWNRSNRPRGREEREGFADGKDIFLRARDPYEIVERGPPREWIQDQKRYANEKAFAQSLAVERTSAHGSVVGNRHGRGGGRQDDYKDAYTLNDERERANPGSDEYTDPARNDANVSVVSDRLGYLP